MGLRRSHGIIKLVGIVCAFGAASLSTVFALAAPPCSIVPLGDLPGGAFGSAASGISADGLVIVGHSRTGPGLYDREAFRWSAQAGMSRLGTINGAIRSEARAVSGDGTTIVGMAQLNPDVRRAFLWSEADGIRTLPDFGLAAEASAVSRDGGVIAGGALNMDGNWTAVRWSQNVMTDLTRLVEGFPVERAYGLAISADGTTVAGSLLREFDSVQQGFQWSSQSGAAATTPFPILSLSDDGACGAGFSVPGDSPSIGFVSCAPEPLYFQPARASCETRAWCISAVGTVVGGSIDGDGCQPLAMIWSHATGMQRLDHILARSRVDLAHWRRLSAVTGISADGRSLCGHGINVGGNTEAFLAQISTLCSADVDDGSGTGTPDGAVTLEDLLYFLPRYDSGDVQADVDDGTGAGTPDGGVTLEDLLCFLTKFAGGC